MPEQNLVFLREKNTSTRTKILYVAWTTLLAAFVIYFWIYKLDTMPGLHGDEAWSGLMANSFHHHALNRITGMTKYTGILQVEIARLIFGYWGVSVFNLRVGGVILNSVGFALLLCFLIYKRRYKMACMMTLILGQSSLFLTSARVAWEVNSFTLLFVAICCIAFFYLINTTSKLAIFIFLFISLVASYNHIIFAALPLAMLAGLCLWSAYYHDFRFKKLIAVSFFNLMNVSLVFLIIRYNEDVLLSFVAWLPLICSFAFFIEILLIDISSGIVESGLNFLAKLDRIVKPILVIAAAAFCYFHGRAFFETLSNYKIVLQFYSYEFSPSFVTILTGCAIVLFVTLIKYLWQDLQEKNSSLISTTIISYLGVLTLFTTETSFRYYLGLNIIIAWYVSYHLSRAKRFFNLPAVSIFLALLINLAINYYLLRSSPMPVRAINFTIGNGKHETSAHFLPKKPLIDFLENNHVSKVDCYNENPYFFVLPIEFYHLQHSWSTTSNIWATTDYNYTELGSGYRLRLEH